MFTSTLCRGTGRRCRSPSCRSDRGSEMERLGGILHTGVFGGIGRLGAVPWRALPRRASRSFPLSRSGPASRCRSPPGSLRARQAASRKSGSKQICHFVGPAHGAGVAIDAQDGGGDVRSFLLHDELPRRFALFAVHAFEHPQPVDRRRIVNRRRLCCARRMKNVSDAVRPEIFPVERAACQRRF